MFQRTLIAACLVVASGAHALGQSQAEVDAAVAKGLGYVKARQNQAQGSFQDKWQGKNYKTGETALALLTMLKSGVAPGDRRIALGFHWLFNQPIQRIYEVSVAILALEARYTPEAKASIQNQDPLATQVRKRFKKKAKGRDRRWLIQAVAFLEKHQDPSGLWKYPFFGEADVSNAQFAILALQSAKRMGIRINPQVWLRTAEGLLKIQEQTGPQVPQFRVPAADGPIKGLHDRRAKAKAKARKRRRARRRGRSTTRERGPNRELVTYRRHKMYARGWGYKHGAASRGSMTAAGLAMLVVCKAELEGHKRYDKRLGPKVDKAIRDGAAWIASRFAVDRNPGADPDWLFYYLYTLERAGTLLATDLFGTRNWYREGARVILDKQQPDGRFDAQTTGESDGTLAGTCLALLFLKRSTVPVIKRVVTGSSSSVSASAKKGGPTITKRADGQLDVTFRYRTTPGKTVAVAGSFNGWSKTANPLRDAKGDGSYELKLTLSAGEHTYKFVIDGNTWTADPANPRGKPDGHGGRNSLLEP